MSSHPLTLLDYLSLAPTRCALPGSLRHFPGELYLPISTVVQICRCLQFGDSPSIVTDIPHCLSIITGNFVPTVNVIEFANQKKSLVACIIFVSTGHKSRQPFSLVDRTIKLLKQNSSFAESIRTSVADACWEFPEDTEVDTLIDRLVGIVMKNVDSIRAM